MITGTVEGDVTVFRGQVRLASSARVGGDLAARAPVVDPGATVAGQVKSAPVLDVSRSFRRVARFALWLAYSLSTLMLGAILIWLAPRGLDAIFRVTRSSVGPSVGWGLAVLFGLPLAAILILVTVVGIPLGLELLLALALILTIGYTASVWFLGRLIVRPPGGRFLAFLAGWAILRAVALVPVLGGLLWTAATVFGLGAIVVAMWRSRREPDAMSSAVATGATPPMPAPPVA
jgi:hypothetical protein